MPSHHPEVLSTTKLIFAILYPFVYIAAGMNFYNLHEQDLNTAKKLNISNYNQRCRLEVIWKAALKSSVTLFVRSVGGTSSNLETSQERKLS